VGKEGKAKRSACHLDYTTQIVENRGGGGKEEGKNNRWPETQATTKKKRFSCSGKRIA